MNFLIAGYGLTWSVLILYTILLYVRLKKAKKELG